LDNFTAVKRQDISSLQNFISTGADINAKDKNGITPLMLAFALLMRPQGLTPN
jgi:ankyrin repeat protein